MSRRGRNQGSPISLFSFQDIITSVTAIMILLVLILTLELITRMNLKGVAADDRRVATELRESLKTLDQRLAALRAETADAKETAMRVASQSVKQVQSDQRDTMRKSETLSTSITDLEVQLRQSRQKRREAEQDLLKAERANPEAARAIDQATRDQAAAAALGKKNEEEDKRQKEVEKELAESPQLVSALVFNPPKGESLRPILTELSAAGIAVLEPGAEAVKTFGWGVLGPPSDFLRWLEERNKAREYLVIMLRPSGLEKLESAKEAILSKGFEVGLELVSEDMDIVMAEDVRKDS